jgi:transposase
MQEQNPERNELRKRIRASVKETAESSTNGREIETRDPKLAVHVIELRAEGHSFKEIAKRTDLNIETVQRVVRTHRKVVDDLKDVMAGEAFNDLSEARALFRRKVGLVDDDELKKTRLDLVAKTLEITHNNYQGSIGEGGGIKINVQTGPTLEQAMQAIEEAKRIADQRLQEKKAESIDT